MVKKSILFRRVTAMFLSMIMLLSSFNIVAPIKAYAASVSVSFYNTGIYYQNTFSFSFPKDNKPSNSRETHTFEKGEEHCTMRGGDKVLYCIQPGVPLSSGNTLNDGDNSWNNLSYAQKKAIALTVYYGYPKNKGDINASDKNLEVATQLIIWEVVCGYRNFDSFGSCSNSCFLKGVCGNNLNVNTGVKNAYNAIVSKVVHHKDIPSFAQKTPSLAKKNPFTLKWNGTSYSKTLKDTSGILKDFVTHNTPSNLTVTKKSNTELVVSTKKSISSSNPTSATIIHLVEGKTESSDDYGIIGYGASGRQAVVYPEDAKPDPVPAYMSFITEPTGSLTVTKNYKRSSSDTTNLDVHQWVVNRTRFYIKNDSGKYITATYTDSTQTKYKYTGYTSDSSKATLFRPVVKNATGKYSFSVVGLPPDTYTVYEKDNKTSGFYKSASQNTTVAISSGGKATSTFTNSTVDLTINKIFNQYPTATADDYGKVKFTIQRYKKNSNGDYVLDDKDENGNDIIMRFKCLDEDKNIYQWEPSATTYTQFLTFRNTSVKNITVVGLPVRDYDTDEYYQYKLIERSADGSTYVSDRYEYKEITKTLTSNSNIINAENSEKNDGSLEVFKHFLVDNGTTTETYNGTDAELTSLYNGISFYITNSSGNRIKIKQTGSNYYQYDSEGTKTVGSTFKMSYDKSKDKDNQSFKVVNLPFGKYFVTEISSDGVITKGFTVDGSSTKGTTLSYGSDATENKTIDFDNIKEENAGFKIYKKGVDENGNEIEISKEDLAQFKFYLTEVLDDGTEKKITLRRTDDTTKNEFTADTTTGIHNYCQFDSNNECDYISISGLEQNKKYKIKEVLEPASQVKYICYDSYSIANGTKTEGSVEANKTTQSVLVTMPNDDDSSVIFQFINKQRSVSFYVEKTSFDNRVERKFKITATNKADFEPIYVTTQLVTDADGNPIKNSNGKIYGTATVNNLPYGYATYSYDGNRIIVRYEYQVEEVELPDCYNSSTSQTLTPNEDGSSKVSFDNTPKTGSIKVIKKAEVNGSTELIPLPDITFELTNDYNSTTKTGTTDKNGEIVFKDLPAAYMAVDEDGNEYIQPITYTVHEVGNDKNAMYELADDATTTIDYTESDATQRFSEILMINQPIKGNVMLDKADIETDELLSGAVFTLYKDVNGNGKYDAGTDTLASGYLETTAEDGTETVTYTESNTMQESIITLTNEEGNVVTDESGNPVMQPTGHYKLTNIPKGKYLIKETKAPDGYIFDDTKAFSFEISKNNQTVYLYEVQGDNYNKVADYGEYYVITKPDGTTETVQKTVTDMDADEETTEEKRYVYNAPILGSVSINKIDKDTRKLLSNATFKVYRDINDNDTLETPKEDETAVDTDIDIGYLTEEMTEVVDDDGNYIMQGTGKYTMSELRVGHYFLIEETAPNGYIKSQIIFRFDIAENGEQEVYYYQTDENGEVVLDSDNNPIKIYLTDNALPNTAVGTLTLTKIDSETMIPLANAEFTLYTDSECKVIYDTQTTDSNGMATFNELVYGTYYLVESKAPPGYIADKTPIQVIVDSADVELGEKYNRNTIPNNPFKFNLPQTGGTDHLLMIGIPVVIILFITGIILLTYRKKQ